MKITKLGISLALLIALALAARFTRNNKPAQASAQPIPALHNTLGTTAD